VIDKRPGASATPVGLHDLLRPATGMSAVELGDGWRVFAPERSDLEQSGATSPTGTDTMMIVPARVKVHLALGYTDMRKGILFRSAPTAHKLTQIKLNRRDDLNLADGG
jgi:hypothetical protein